ncbi:unnamed protein product [Penicillium salamii]|nr:unnamed protein product [Penicillium salamii]CAG8412559.1 unnamed protein product [Penicillium salamii]
MRFLNFSCMFVMVNVVSASSLAIVHGTDGKDNCRVCSNDNSMEVDICGTENGERIAWVTVNKNGIVTFLNRMGDTSSCTLENGLQVPSNCSIGNMVSSQSTTPISTTRQSSFTNTIRRSDSQTAQVDKSLTAVYTSTSPNSAYSTSSSNTGTFIEDPLADQSQTLTYTPTFTCSCKSALSDRDKSTP